MMPFLFFRQSGWEDEVILLHPCTSGTYTNILCIQLTLLRRLVARSVDLMDWLDWSFWLIDNRLIHPSIHEARARAIRYLPVIGIWSMTPYPSSSPSSHSYPLLSSILTPPPPSPPFPPRPSFSSFSSSRRQGMWSTRHLVISTHPPPKILVIPSFYSNLQAQLSVR